MDQELVKIIGVVVTINLVVVGLSTKILLAFFKREVGRFDLLLNQVKVNHERLLAIEYQIPDIKKLTETILSASEGEAMWKRIDSIKKAVIDIRGDITAIRSRQHELGNHIQSMDAKFHLREWGDARYQKPKKD